MTSSSSTSNDDKRNTPENAPDDKHKSSSPEADDVEAPKADIDESQVASSSTATSHPSQGAWQAIWSPSHNAYYFYNSETQETTWTNPLQAASSMPEASTSAASAETETPGASSSAAAEKLSLSQQLQAAAIAQGIDPSLAHLDPSLVQTPVVEGYTAKFNARTGTFARPDGRDPTHLSEYERAKRMSEFYFDVNQWQEEVAERKRQEEAEGKKRKRPTKQDLERFKEQKKAKKVAKTAWLRT
ncbi:hypothetical protein BXZ70DRAFT_1006954 [Cristinia sonorae]|uniref:WW domain-containing protein n=1 Tax=Cristinia sonorae TaxID=1940300 RepID=A0A8K0URD5_9AGAR|nr:hypothetical protein BXZ70DRAFT_1006954 [Cristinia sonorae]